jgi:dTDP-4-dehydrorhamnose 3,5-epimerase-like enzyme
VPNAAADPPAALPVLASFWDGRVRVLQLPEHADPRGTLVAFDGDGLPFAPRRVFFVHSAAVGSVRGQHAHRRGQQVLCCLAGSVAVELRLGGATQSLVLGSPRSALVVDAPVWSALRVLAPGTLILVMVSEPFDPDGYVVDGSSDEPLD